MFRERGSDLFLRRDRSLIVSLDFDRKTFIREYKLKYLKSHTPLQKYILCMRIVLLILCPFPAQRRLVDSC